MELRLKSVLTLQHLENLQQNPCRPLNWGAWRLGVPHSPNLERLFLFYLFKQKYVLA